MAPWIRDKNFKQGHQKHHIEMNKGNVTHVIVIREN